MQNLSGKRHTSQNTQQRFGQYHTTNADKILEGYESVVRGKEVIDPFAGGHDLLNWAMKHGASKKHAYDLLPKDDETIQNDSLRNPPDYSNKILISNPPYLSRNKCKDEKDVFDQWNQTDYYKCHLASLADHQCQEALIIIPSNFFSESRDSARRMLFENFYIISAKYWTEPAFENTDHSICVIHVKKGNKNIQNFEMLLMPDNEVISVSLEKSYNYLHGKDFFDYINNADKDFLVQKTDKGMLPPNTKIVVGLLDNGKWQSGLSINNTGKDIYCNPKSFTTYQVTLPQYDLTYEQQVSIVEMFNQKMDCYRKKYHILFLANYMGPKQKILSRTYVNKLMNVVMKELGHRFDPCSENQLFL